MPNHYYIDIPTALIIILSFIHGYRKGILAFVVALVAIAATFIFFPLANSLLATTLDVYNSNIFFRILLLLLIYVLLRIVLENFRALIERILKAIFLQWINKIVGGIFIAFIALSIIWIVYVVLAFVLPSNPLELNSIILNGITNIVFTKFDVYEIL